VSQLPLAQRAHQVWADLPALIGTDGEYQRSGHFKIGRSEADMASLEAYANLSRDFDLGIQLISGTTLRERCPWLGGKAVGVPGTEVFTGEKMKGDLGWVGEVTDCKLGLIQAAVAGEFVPVVSPVARDLATGKTLNVNADLAACALATRLKATKLIFLSDVRGVMRDPKDDSTLIPSLDPAAIDALKKDGIISGGMIPKVDSSLESLRGGVGKVHLIDGRIPHALILEIFTDVGIGTEIHL